MGEPKKSPGTKTPDDRAKARRVVRRVVCNGEWLYLGTEPDPVGKIIEALVDANLIRAKDPANA